VPRPRIRIVNESGHAFSTKVFVEDIDVSAGVSSIRINPVAPGAPVTADVTFVGVELDIAGQLEGPLLTLDVPPSCGDALPFARTFKLLYEASLASAVSPPAWTSYVFKGRDGTFMIEADPEFEGSTRLLRKLDSPYPHQWTEVDD
jgi:hypothetical protein